MTEQLLYIPLPAEIETRFRDTFRKELETMSLDEIVASSVDLIIDPARQTTTRAKKISKYLRTIHTRDELEEIMRRHIRTILGDSDSIPQSPTDATPVAHQAEPAIALGVLGLAIAIWLIGWAITGECDWYMGMYSP